MKTTYLLLTLCLILALSSSALAGGPLSNLSPRACCGCGNGSCERPGEDAEDEAMRAEAFLTALCSARGGDLPVADHKKE